MLNHAFENFGDVLFGEDSNKEDFQSFGESEADQLKDIIYEYMNVTRTRA